jgi:hypothetical protein
MATRTRPEVRSLGATWNDTMLWYAKAVHELRERPVIKKASWRYLAAMHDFDQGQWIKLGYLARRRCGSKHSAGNEAVGCAIHARCFRKNPPARILVNLPAWPGHFDVEIDCVAAVL